MLDDVPQELKDEAAAVLLGAADVVAKVLFEAEGVMNKVMDQLNDWADALRAAPDAESGGTDTRYLYLLNHHSNSEQDRKVWAFAKAFLLSPEGEDVLEALYRGKVEQSAQPYDFWTVLKQGFGTEE